MLLGVALSMTLIIGSVSAPPRSDLFGLRRSASTPRCRALPLRLRVRSAGCVLLFEPSLDVRGAEAKKPPKLDRRGQIPAC
jgi:hypothetical protein